MRDDEEAVQHTESERWNGEEIHRGNSLPVILQEGLPALRRLWVRRCFMYPARDGSFRDIESELQQLTVNARSAPGGIFGGHAENQITKLLADLRSAKSLLMAG